MDWGSDAKPINVGELIAELQQFPLSTPIVYQCCSEFTLLRAGDVSLGELHPPRPDGWVHRYDRGPQAETLKFVIFPGN